MPESPPANVFSHTIDPAGVLQTLRDLGATVKADGPDDDWRAAEVTFSSGGLFSRKKRMISRHGPDYYAPESFEQQLPGMTGYVMRSEVPPSEPFLAAIRSFRFSVNFTPESFDPADPRWAAVLAVCKHLDGVIMLPGVFLDAHGRVLHALQGEPDPSAVPPERRPPNPVLVPTGGLYDRSLDRFPLPPYREAAVAELTRRGFRAPWWIPTDPVALRSPEDIARRLLALQALFYWVVRQDVPDDVLRERATRDRLVSALTESEAQLFAAPRVQAQQAVHAVGWRLENMWPLAWALGFDPAPEPAAGMIDDATIRRLLEFLPTAPEGSAVDALLAAASPRSADEVGAMEDLFYCAHHAVRSAQLGRATVPEGFHPMIDGGVIHERRHALSWMVGGDVSWDETHLGT